MRGPGARPPVAEPALGATALHRRMTTLDRDHPVFILAMDHRDSLAKTTYGVDSGQPTDPAVIARISAGKQLVYRGLLDALSRGADRARAGVLVDERYGAEVARMVKDAGLQLAMPIEASGQDFFAFEYGDGTDGEWMRHVEEFDPDYVKVLVRDNPAFDESDRAGQATRLAAVTTALHDAGRTFLLELLVPGTDDQEDSVDDYDRDLRPTLTVEVVGYLQEHGVEPDVWKIEGLDRREDAERIVAATRQGGRDSVQCIILGRDAAQEDLDRWLSVAAPVDGFVGFAIGRSIWEEPLGHVVDGEMRSEDAEDVIAANYRHFEETYRDAC
ncbi:2-deoxy-5-keto-D-gluconate 6-phosphate aldolase domain-containing protein [Curtobacterium sp. RRHDQ10]|uniref:2-deoxy-5-keto-D-gluconate 6-phosphate aldolase domain-containing protein n=1 Tax=Curtobacterium phyllosphaerae TaxID=3413379 RepID=UPI003BF33B92